MSLNLLSSQNAAQFAINAFQRVEIALGPVSANLQSFASGRYFPEIEGTSIYVERCDYPVQLTFVNAAGGAGQSFVLRQGSEITCPFKGFTLTAPSFNSSAGLSLIVGKHGAQYTNTSQYQLNDLNGVSQRIITNTAVDYKVGIFVPQGVRSFNNCSFVIPATALTTAQVSFYDASGNVIQAPISEAQQFGGAAVTYPNNPGGSYWGTFVNTSSTSPLINFPQMMVPSQAREIQIEVVGTGLGVATNGIGGNWG